MEKLTVAEEREGGSGASVLIDKTYVAIRFQQFRPDESDGRWSESEHRLGVISFGLWGFGVFPPNVTIFIRFISIHSIQCQSDSHYHTITNQTFQDR